MVPTKFQFIWLRGFRGIFICNSIHRDTKCNNVDMKFSAHDASVE